MSESAPILNAISIAVRDMAASLTFYRRLGVVIPEDSVWPSNDAGHHVTVKMPSGFNLDLDSAAMTKSYDGSWSAGTGSSNALIFSVPSRQEVDRLYGVMTAAGHVRHLEPFDAFWGARYAVIDDPDGNHVGIMSPMDEKYASAPPQL